MSADRGVESRTRPEESEHSWPDDTACRDKQLIRSLGENAKGQYLGKKSEHLNEMVGKLLRRQAEGSINIFFADRHLSGDDEEAVQEAAKLVCKKCDVREECLEFALQEREDDGTWGGLTEKERRTLRRSQRQRR